MKLSIEKDHLGIKKQVLSLCKRPRCKKTQLTLDTYYCEEHHNRYEETKLCRDKIIKLL
jgi:hypothetical protein